MHGTIGLALDRARAADAELGRLASSSARTAGVGQGLASALSGARDVGLAGARRGRRRRRPHERGAARRSRAGAAGGLRTDQPAAGRDAVAAGRAPLERTAGRGARGTAPGGASPRVRGCAPPARAPCRSGACAAATPGRTRWALSGVDLDLRAGGAGRADRAQRGGQDDARVGAACDSCPTAGRSRSTASRSTTCRPRRSAGVVGLVAQDAHVFDTTIEENLRLARRDASRAPSCSRCSSGCACWSGFARCPTGWPRRWGSRGGASPAASAAASRSRAACWRDFPLLILDEPGEHLDAAHRARALTSELHRGRRAGARCC